MALIHYKTRKNLLRTLGVMAVMTVTGACPLHGAELAVTNAVLEDKTLRDSITYPTTNVEQEIMFSFDKPYTCGQYANGEWWVAVDPATKSVVVTGIRPNYADGKNGWCVNPANHVEQPFDFRGGIPFSSNSIPALPYKAGAGDSLVKAVSGTIKVGHSWVQSARVVTVVAAPPAKLSRTFRPPYMGFYKPEFSVDDLQLALLPRLATVPGAISKDAAERGWSCPRLDYSSSCFSGYFRPVEATDSWGTDMAVDDCNRFFWLCLDRPVEEKMKTLVCLVQYGVDLFGARKSLGTDWVHGGGGNGNGRLLPFVFAATMLNSIEMKKELAKAACADKQGSFWEMAMFHRLPRSGLVVWGNWYEDKTIEAVHWKSLSVDESYFRTGADPYEWIDGGSEPGDGYQGCVSATVKYTALILRLIPQLQKSWPEEKIKLMEYADRWVERGTHALPDPIAPAVKLTEEEWKHKEDHGYGKTWGPDPAHPGDAIHGSGRFPERQGLHVDSAGASAPRVSKFGIEMWKAYRGLGSPPN